ncbi:MAG: hypothetical protein Q4F66_02530 [Clostridium sp.]|nr:hypothetical protein [Clostridium sp.]
MKLNNLYNFKNPIKHFLNIDSFIFPDNITSYDIKDLSWTIPIKFRVKKSEDKYRTLKMPNILNFKASYEHFKDLPDFESIQAIDYGHKRLSANIETGDFESGEFDRQLERDFEKLCIYDVLLKVDIKEYYGRIYTHYIDLQNHNEQYLSNMNLGATNGLIMGNYLSLYFAEVNLNNISNEILAKITALDLQCEFSYFSDDFYFFCNKSDIDNVINIFDEVLEKYDLERNDTKKEIWTYESYNNYNIVERYWKKIIAKCNIKFDEEINDNRLYFINQLMYRMSKLSSIKLKKVFINNFFKTSYFQNLDLNKYEMRSYDYHQLCFIFKFSPESMIYAISKFNEKHDFHEKQLLYKFFFVRYREALESTFHEEQLYFYFAIKRLGFTDILDRFKELVIRSNNQILISYYLKDRAFNENQINKLKENEDEEYWFQNYHLILYCNEMRENMDDSILRYLVPRCADKQRQKQSYINFYKINLEAGIPIIRDIDNTYSEIKDYLNLKAQESKTKYQRAAYKDMCDNIDIISI